MIKVYLDWNVMNSMKQGNIMELKSILSNRRKFLVPYSTSHIGDILVSYSENEKQKEIIENDLNFITSLTENYCFFNDGKNIQLGGMDPIEMFNDRIDFQNIFKDFSIDSLFSSIKDDDKILGPIINSYKSLLKSLPLDDALLQVYKNPESAKEMEKHFPGLKEDLTMDGLFKSFGKMLHNLNEEEGYKDLRNDVQKVGVNSSHFNKDKNPYEIISKAYEKLGIDELDTNQYIDNSKNAPVWFNEISKEYIMLDMHGYKQDKIKVTKKKKNTFKNTTEDSFHSAFASRCDFYITNDKRNIDKTKTVYSKLKVETCVLTPEEFVNYYNKFLNFHNFLEHFDNLTDVLLTGKNYYVYGNEKDEKGKHLCFFGISNHYFFNFFNKVRICKSSVDSSLYYLISRKYPSKVYYVALKEIENLVEMLIRSLGMDDKEKGLLKTGDIDSQDWEGRKWTLDRMQINLIRLNGWFQLYFYPLKEKKKTTSEKIKYYFKNFFKTKV